MVSKTLSVKTAKDPIANPEVISVPMSADQVACDGGHPSLGHPITYYTFDNRDKIECGYCDRQFVRKSK
jgi:uncharacterized Zn-finger protein